MFIYTGTHYSLKFVFPHHLILFTRNVIRTATTQYNIRSKFIISSVVEKSVVFHRIPTNLRATASHLSYEVTQYVLPPDAISAHPHNPSRY